MASNPGTKYVKRTAEESAEEDASCIKTLFQLSAGESKGNEENAVHVEDREAMKAETSFDVSGGTRAFLTEESAEELLKPLLASGHSFIQVCLSNWSFGNGSAEVAARALSAAKDKLVDVNLADIVAGRPEAEALKAMTTISSALEGSKLKSLNLSDNALGEKGVRAFSALLSSQSSLQALYFMNNGISEEAARAISELLPSAKELRTLRFHNNMSGDPGAEELAGVVKMAPLLEYFQMSSSRVGIAGGIALMEALRNGESLRVLDIRDNMYGPEGGRALAQTLRLHNLLTEVYLSDLGLEDEGALAVIKALSEGSSQVRVLELGGNEITEKSAPTLAICLRAMKLLTRLNLTENELKDKGAVTICNVLKEEHENLEELDVSVNELGRIGAVAAARAVANKKGFKSLNLNGNQISDTGIEALKEVLSKSKAGPGVLGSLEDNEEETEEEDDEEEEQEDDEDESEVTGISNLEVS